MPTKTQPDLTQLRDYLIQMLPQLLREEPELVATIDSIVARQFPRRDEFARLLDEVKQLRQEMNLCLELQSQETHQRMGLMTIGTLHIDKGQILGEMEAWLRITIGTLHSDKSQILEEMFAAGLRYGLKDDEITPETIRLQIPLTDTEGLVFKKGYVTEVDLVAQNGKRI